MVGNLELKEWVGLRDVEGQGLKKASLWCGISVI